MNTKTCSSCNAEKPATSEFFGLQKRNKDGLRYECKECRNQSLVHHWNENKTELKCMQCATYKDPSSFDYNGNIPHRDNKDRRCKQCKSESARNRRMQRYSIDPFHRTMLERWHGLSDRAKNKSIEMSITLDDLKEMYHKQNGLCAVSGIGMTYLLGQGRIPTNVSVDQIIPSGGYTIDNIQLVCMAVNQMKSDLNDDELLMFCEAIAKNARKWKH